MRLGEKIRYLREVEGALRGLGREMTQQQVVRAVKKELRKPISQSYLSQIESGARPTWSTIRRDFRPGSFPTWARLRTSWTCG